MISLTVSILGLSKWDWGKGDVAVIRVDERFYAQCLEADDQNEADHIGPGVAMDLLTRRGVRLTTAGRKWMREQRPAGKTSNDGEQKSMNGHNFKRQYIQRAQAATQQRGLKVGDTVAHPDEPVTCYLLEIHGDRAVIGWKNIRREFPLNELFDPNIARREALRIRGEVN